MTANISARRPITACPNFGSNTSAAYRGSDLHERLLRGERYVQVADVRAAAETLQSRATIRAGTRTLLMVPLRKEGALLGFITAHRREVRPFSDKEIALLEAFAAQAVIAVSHCEHPSESSRVAVRQSNPDMMIRARGGSQTRGVAEP